MTDTRSLREFRDSGISSLAKNTIRHWFERRHRGDLEHDFAQSCIRDAQLHRRVFGRRNV